MNLNGVRKHHVLRVVPTMASVYLGQLHVLHPLNTDDDRFVQSALLPPTDHSALTSHHHRHITVRIEHRRDHIHVSRFANCRTRDPRCWDGLSDLHVVVLLFLSLLLLQDMIVVFFFSALYSLLSLLLAVGKCKPCCSAGVALFQLLLLFLFLLLLQIAVLL